MVDGALGFAPVRWFGRRRSAGRDHASGGRPRPTRAGWARPAGPPAPAVDATALLARVRALGLDDARVARVEPETLWAAGWEPPPLTAHAAVLALAQGAADAVVLEPLDLADAQRVLHRLWPLSPVMQALVALRAGEGGSRSLTEDPLASHGNDLASALGWAGELLDRANAARSLETPEEGWAAAAAASRWCGSLASRRYAHPDRAELLHTAAALTRLAGDADFAPTLVPVAGGAAPTHAVTELSLRIGATLLRAMAADLPAAGALLAGASSVDGLRLLPATSVPVASLLEFADDVHTDHAWRVYAPREHRWALRDLAAAREDVVRAWGDNPAPGPHGDYPPDQAFDGSAMDRAEAALARVADGAEQVLAGGPDPPLVGALARTAVSLCQTLRAPRGWRLWDEEAFALESLARLTARLQGATIAARRRL